MKSRHSVQQWCVAAAAALACTAAPALAQTPPARAAGEVKQEAKQAAQKTGNAFKDSWITMKIHSQFVPEDALNDSDIDVDTRAGHVTLNGTVVTQAGRERAVAIAKATDGVKGVTDNLKIGVADYDLMKDASRAARETGTTGKEVGKTTGTAGKEIAKDTKEGAKSAGKTVTDGWVKSKIYFQILGSDTIGDNDIDIDITRGAVTLNGAVRTAAAKAKAVEIAKATDGVKSVKDNLKVVPSVQ
jgi:hyperosmotically inducible protein